MSHPAQARYARASLRAALIAAGVVSLVLAAPFPAGRFYFGVDLTRSDIGMICAIQRHLEAGAPLATSPLLGNGLPISFDPVAQLFYPIRWLVLPFQPDLAASLEAVLHLAIGAAATAWLARTFRVRPEGAALAGIAFALSGTALNLIVHSCYSVSAAWLPLAWAAARRAVGPRRRPWHAVCLSAALALCLLGGEPQSFAIGSALAVFEVARALAARRRRAFGRGAVVGLAIAAAFMIGLRLWAGALVEYQLGQRGGALATSEILEWSLTPDDWAGVVLPSMLLRQFRPGAGWKQLWFGLGHTDRRLMDQWNRTPYLGFLLLAVVVSGLASRRARGALVVMGAGALLTLGAATPVMPFLLKVLPFVGTFRYPAKYLLVTTLAGVVAGAIILEAAGRSGAQRRRTLVAVLAMAGGVGAMAGALAIARDEVDRLPINLIGADRFPGLPWLASALIGGLLHNAILLALLALGLILAGRHRRWLAVLLVADYAVAAAAFLETGPPIAAHTSPLSTLRSAEEPVPVICESAGTMERQAMGARTSSSAWPQALRLRETAQPYLHACDGLSHGNGYSPMEARTEVALNAALSRGLVSVARALGCTHQVAMARLLGGPVQFVPVPRYGAENRGGAKVYALVNPIPHAFVARGARLLGTEKEVLRAIQTATDLAGVLQLVDDPMHRLPPGAQLPAGGEVTAGDLAWPVWDHAVLPVQGHGGAVVGIRRAFAVGWTAAQSGRALPVVRVAGTELGVVVDDVTAGEVTLEYEPPRNNLASLALALGLAIEAALLLAPRVRALRRR